jgi:thiosulfate dehydrogenase [quinone] large subunit
MDFKEFIANIWNKKDSALWIVFLRIIIGFEWFYAGLTKIIQTAPSFPEGMAGTLGFFSTGAPTWMANWLTSMLPAATALGYLVMIGEFLIGLALMFGFMVNLSAIVGIFFNFLFFFAAGWLGPSTLSINWIMWAIQILFILSPGVKKLGLDGLLAREYPFLRRWLVDWFGFEKDLKQ